MASYKYDKSTRKAEIQFYDRDRKRRTVRLSDVTKTFADRFHTAVERLNDARRTGGSIDNHVADFVRELGDVYYAKLAKVDLVAPRMAPIETDDVGEPEVVEPLATLGPYLTAYLETRTDLKPSTLLIYRQVEQNLRAYFTPAVPIESITEGHVVDFGRWLDSQGYSRTTIDRRLSFCRTIFSHAVLHRLLPANPFDGFRKQLRGLVSRNNRKRMQLIPRDHIARVLEQCPDAEWRCLVALSRFAGLRVPSEALSLRWSDVDWHQNVIRIPCPKLEHIEGHEDREIPIFAELRPHLEECFESAEPGADYVITRNRPPVLKSGAGWANANLRTRLEKIIKRAGLKPWPRLWHNMRASCQTELSDVFPAHVVCRWIGNSEDVAREHYLQVTPEHFQRAVTGGVMPQVMLSGDESGSMESQRQISPIAEDGRNSVGRKEKRPHAKTCDRRELVGGGLEPPTCGL